MSRLNVLYKKRLERVRKELNLYIRRYIPFESTSEINSDVVAGAVPKEKKRLQDSFLHCMKLSDDLDDESYEDDEIGLEEQLDKCECRPSSVLRAPGPASTVTSSKESVPLRIPEFLRRQDGQLDLDKALENKDETFSEMLLRLIDEKQLKDSDVYKRANIDRRLFSKIRGDEEYVPSKKTAISFCLALQLELNDAIKLLETAGYTLSTSSRFDLIIRYLIENSEYNIHFANIVLDDYGEGTLSR